VSARPASTQRLERRPRADDKSHPLTDCEYVPPGLRIEIDKNVPSESATLPRWTFARALLVEARKTGKSRDVRTAARPLNQALSNERWLDVE
jgi:hypothetical protein